MEKPDNIKKKFKISKHSIRNVFRNVGPAQPTMEELLQAKLRLNTRLAADIAPATATGTFKNRANLNESKVTSQIVEIKDESVINDNTNNNSRASLNNTEQ